MKFSLVRFIGVGFLIASILIASLGYYYKYPMGFTFSLFNDDFYANISTELASIAITILIIDYLNQRRDEKIRKERLIREIGSHDNGIALRALEELRVAGWLQDGSLHNVFLKKANLEGSNFQGSDLTGAILSGANLRGADLQDTNLLGANMNGANLNQANLSYANLSYAILWGASLEMAKLDNATVKGGNLNQASLRWANLNNINLELAQLQGTIVNQEQLVNARSLEGTDIQNIIPYQYGTNPNKSHFSLHPIVSILRFFTKIMLWLQDTIS